MSKPSPARGRATSWTQSDAARRRRGSLLVWLDPGMEWLAPPSGRPGRPETVSDAAIQDPLPPLGRRPRSAGRRHRRGVARAKGDWRVREQGPSRRRQWRRAHLALSRPTAPDGPSPPPRRRHAAATERGDAGLIPIRGNGRPWNEDRAAAKAGHGTLRASRHFGRALWEHWTGHHARSRVEARTRCLKAFAERIASGDPDRQTAGLHARVALMNRSSALGQAEVVSVA